MATRHRTSAMPNPCTHTVVQPTHTHTQQTQVPQRIEGSNGFTRIADSNDEMRIRETPLDSGNALNAMGFRQKPSCATHAAGLARGTHRRRGRNHFPLSDTAIFEHISCRIASSLFPPLFRACEGWAKKVTVLFLASEVVELQRRGDGKWHQMGDKHRSQVPMHKPPVIFFGIGQADIMLHCRQEN